MRRSERLAAAVFWLGVAAALGMFLVLVMGATVTTTGSAEGCGRDWPLCRGKFIPDFALATAIEFSHRAVTGIEAILVVALTVAVLVLYGGQRPVRVLAPLMFGFLLLQAGMGAWAVVSPQQPVILALHFGISLIAVASTALTALYVRRPGAMLSAPAVAGGMRLATWGMAAYLYLLVYSGAYIRHAAAAAACPSWPLCSGAGTPMGAEAVAVNLGHRVAAGVAFLLAICLLAAYHRFERGRRDLAAGAWMLVGAMVAQAGAGAFLVLSRWGVSGELLHAALSGVTFTAAAYLCLRVTLGKRQEAVATAPPPRQLRAEGAP
jgi:cytochrome c oxidase assembly protein subunit 15